jgi:Sugar-specific transcriptional regulator TrmB
LRVSDTKLVSLISGALADKECSAIIENIRLEPKHAQRISLETKIPLSSVYRKLAELKSAGLVMVEEFTVKSGKKTEYLQTCFLDVKLEMSEGKRTLELNPRSQSVNLRWVAKFGSS